MIQGVLGFFLAAMGVTWFIFHFFLPNEEAANTVNALIRAHAIEIVDPSNLPQLVNRLVERDAIKTDKANHLLDVYKNGKIVWSGIERKWIPIDVVEKQRQKEEWLRQHRENGEAPGG